MEKKELQEKRIKNYFIKAAKDVITREGVSGLTVKKVAELAGYAPGTLYNYFADVNILLLNCIKEFWKECKTAVFDTIDPDIGVQEKITRFSRNYAEYFMNNPHIFKLIFLEDLGIIPDTFLEGDDVPEVAFLLRDALEEAAVEKLIPEDKITILENLIDNSIHGMLLSFIKGRTSLEKNEVMNLIEETLDYLLKG